MNRRSGTGENPGGGSMTSLWDRPGYLVRRLHQIHVALFLDECAEFKITPVQYAVMTTLLNRPGADQINIAQDAGIDRTNVSDVLARLEQRGLVTRATSAEDRRQRVAHLTNHGDYIARKMETASLAAQSKLIEPLTEGKRKQLMLLMTELVESNNEYSRAPARKCPQAE